MSLLDAYVCYRFLKTLATPWDQMPAYKLGIIDAHGKQLKKSDELKTEEEKNAYGLFERMVFNLKRLINKAPGGQSQIATYAAALYLLHEDKSLTPNAQFSQLFVEAPVHINNLFERQFLFNEGTGILKRGRYRLKQDVIDQHGNVIPKGDVVVVTTDERPEAVVLGTEVFRVQHAKTQKDLVVAHEDVAAI